MLAIGCECLYSGIMTEQIGIVTRGINNIYSVVPLSSPGDLGTGPAYSCRIKGKVLHGVCDAYNPLAVGDRVVFSVHQGQEGLILKREKRTNSFDRWNAKRKCNQTVVANMDLLVCVASTDEPPFRPRFIDRAIVCARGMPVLIVLNKCDLMFTETENERFQLYRTLGYDTFAMSAFDSDGIERLSALLSKKMCAVIGQSGVGKSTLVNALVGADRKQRIGAISAKYHRGRHTTNHAVMLFAPGCAVVDTPGIRELSVPHDDPVLIGETFPEFRNVASECSYQPCLHDHEPGCRVKALVASGKIHPDRYESYLRMLASLDDRPESWESDRR